MPSEAGDGGAWIGIDFGTTHSCAAVWDSTRCRPKAMRLDSALPEGSKHGRLVPTVLVLVHSTAQDQVSSLLSPRDRVGLYTTDNLQSLGLVAVVGAPALRLLLHDDNNRPSTREGEKVISPSISPEKVSAAMITNLKLHFSAGGSATSSALPGTIVEEDVATATPIGMSSQVRIKTSVLVQTFLAALKHESELYLHRNGRRKRLVVPQRRRQYPPPAPQAPSTSAASAATAAPEDGPMVRIDHAVIGVPCQWNQKLRHRLERISVCRRHESIPQPQEVRSVSSQAKVAVVAWEPFRSALALSEPTAAALSYGLGYTAKEKTVMVVDMGGGTTDVTVAQLSNEEQHVTLTVGSQVGGNDVDQALLEWFLQQSESSRTAEYLSQYERRLLLRACKDAKEELCSRWSTDEHVDLLFRNRKVRLDQATFESISEPILTRTEAIVAQALDKYFASSPVGAERVTQRIDEVVLVGGSTKIPAVAKILKRATRCQELCQVHPLTAVAQGAAIHAARLSSCVPPYELKSALLLDAIPYAIGVMVSPPPACLPTTALSWEDGGDFVPVLSQYASVPATGSVRFALAKKEQTGVTVPVVECIDVSSGQFEMIQTFQFLLRKLSAEELQSISVRFVEIRIRFTELGQLIVTAVDEHDPDHQRKYHLFGDDVVRTSKLPSEAPPVGLVVTVISLAILYVAVKLAFHEVELKDS